jgi:hypothetical protein
MFYSAGLLMGCLVWGITLPYNGEIYHALILQIPWYSIFQANKWGSFRDRMGWSIHCPVLQTRYPMSSFCIACLNCSWFIIVKLMTGLSCSTLSVNWYHVLFHHLSWLDNSVGPLMGCLVWAITLSCDGQLHHVAVLQIPSYSIHQYK